MGRNSTQPKIKIKIITFLQRKLHIGIFRLHMHLFFLLKAVPRTLVTATAHDVTRQRIRSFVPQRGKNSLNHSLWDSIMKSCNQVVTFESVDVTVQMTVLTIRMKPLQRYFHILSTYFVCYNSHFWNCLTKSCGMTMQNLSISSSFTCLSVIKCNLGVNGKRKLLRLKNDYFEAIWKTTP